MQNHSSTMRLISPISSENLMQSRLGELGLQSTDVDGAGDWQKWPRSNSRSDSCLYLTHTLRRTARDSWIRDTSPRVIQRVWLGSRTTRSNLWLQAQLTADRCTAGSPKHSQSLPTLLSYSPFIIIMYIQKNESLFSFANTIWVQTYFTTVFLYTFGFSQKFTKVVFFCFKELTSIYANILGQKKVLTKDEFICHRTGLEHQRDRQFISMKHQYDCHNVMWKRSIFHVSYNAPYLPLNIK